jgi:hypothetical protein
MTRGKQMPRRPLVARPGTPEPAFKEAPPKEPTRPFDPDDPETYNDEKMVEFASRMENGYLDRYVNYLHLISSLRISALEAERLESSTWEPEVREKVRIVRPKRKAVAKDGARVVTNDDGIVTYVAHLGDKLAPDGGPVVEFQGRRYAKQDIMGREFEVTVHKYPDRTFRIKVLGWGPKMLTVEFIDMPPHGSHWEKAMLNKHPVWLSPNVLAPFLN